MAPLKRTSSGWWDATWNTLFGCRPVSSGCLNCFAARDAGTLQKATNVAFYRNTTTFKGGRYAFNGQLRERGAGDPEWTWPLRWPGAAQPLLGPVMPSLIFVNGMSEMFMPERPQRVIDRTMGMLALSGHIGLLLTKLPREMSSYITAQPGLTQRRWREKFWLGFSAETQSTFDQRWPAMRGLAEQGWTVFCSVAPMLAPVRLPADFLALGNRGWVICSGEQGPHRHCRRMDTRWARALRNQCREAGVAFFMKQLDRERAIQPGLLIREFPAVQRSKL